MFASKVHVIILGEQQVINSDQYARHCPGLFPSPSRCAMPSEENCFVRDRVMGKVSSLFWGAYHSVKPSLHAVWLCACCPVCLERSITEAFREPHWLCTLRAMCDMWHFPHCAHWVEYLKEICRIAFTRVNTGRDGCTFHTYVTRPWCITTCMTLEITAALIYNFKLYKAVTANQCNFMFCLSLAVCFKKTIHRAS